MVGQVTMNPVVALPDTTPPPASTTDTPIGSVSETTTFSAPPGPLLLTVTVQVMFSPTATVSGPDLRTLTFTGATTVVSNVARLSAKFASVLADEAAAMST